MLAELDSLSAKLFLVVAMTLEHYHYRVERSISRCSKWSSGMSHPRSYRTRSIGPGSN
jgi:hypothetical protein